MSGGREEKQRLRGEGAAASLLTRTGDPRAEDPAEGRRFTS